MFQIQASNKIPESYNIENIEDLIKFGDLFEAETDILFRVY